MSETEALLEREREAARLAAAVHAAVAGRGGLALIEGPAGIGKTRLLRHATALAAEAGLSVLGASGSELEREFGFGVVRQLLERRAAGRLDGAAALAAPALGLSATGRPDGAAALAAPALGLPATGRPEGVAALAAGRSATGRPEGVPALAAGLPAAAPADAADARFAALHGLYWLVATLAAEGPLLLAVDDAQWADEPSLRFLAYLARRVTELPVALVLATRPPPAGEDATVLEALAAEAGDPLTPAPLSTAAVAALAAQRLGEPPAAAFAAACRRVTGGNALLVEEVLAELRETGTRADAAAAAVLEHSPAPPGVERVRRRVGRRLDALGEAAAPLAEAVAVLGDGCELALAAALAGVEAGAARRAAVELVAADVFEDAGALRFRHPLIRAAVADRPPAAERGRAHGRAARLLAARGAPPGVLATHLLAAPPGGDPWVTATLVAAAREAGAPELAAAHLRRALDEPPPEPERAAVLLELGRAEHAAGVPGAPERLTAAWRATGDAGIALELASTLAEQARWRESAAVAREALGGAAGELALRLLAVAADAVRMDPTIGGDEPARLRARVTTLGGATAAERFALATAAVVTPVDTAAAHAHAAELAWRSLQDGPRAGETGIVSNLIRAGRLDAAAGVAEQALADARRGGFVQRHASMLSMRAWIALDRGALADARDDLETVLAFEPDLPAHVSMAAAAMLALALAEFGELERAEALLGTHALGGALPEHQVMNPVLHFRSRVRLAQGRTDDALADALAVGRRYERLNIRRAVPPWRSQAAVLLAARDERERALTLAAEELELAERWGTPLARSFALRGLGLVTGDLAALAEAARLLEDGPHRLEHARARLELGAALRRGGRRAEAREPLRWAMDAAHALGARPLAERARTELLATGARPRRLALAGPDALTPSERRIAGLAASGLSNRRIAQELFVTTATVETHLRHAFRKLDVSSRAELPDALKASR